MIYGSVCSGIEAATVAWRPFGWKAAWLSEIEKFPSAVLQRHYPDVPNLGDMTKIHESEVFNGSAIDVLVGGTPCQSFSIAGLRKGMDDPRGNLALVFLALLDRKRPQWVVWENVPGVLSSWSDEAGSFTDEEDGRERGWQSNDFDTFTSGLAQLGYGVAWRGKPLENCPDGPRYKAIGNSMAVPVMRWIGQRIQAVEDIVAK